MDDRLRCLEEINNIRSVAAGTDVAYVARSRLGRLLLHLSRTVCKEIGVPPPDRPVVLFPKGINSPRASRLAETCNKLNETARTLCQPSEPLDGRWRSGWSELISELNKLEAQL